MDRKMQIQRCPLLKLLIRPGIAKRRFEGVPHLKHLIHLIARVAEMDMQGCPPAIPAIFAIPDRAQKAPPRWLGRVNATRARRVVVVPQAAV